MISIVIPAHNEAAYLPYTLRSVWIAVQQVDPPCQIIVVDDASTDITAAIAAETGAQVVRVNLRHIAAVRNAGAAAAMGDLLVFIDADTRIDAALLQAMWDAYQRGCVGGGAKVAFDTDLPHSARAMLQTWNFLSRMCRWAAGSCVFARRDAFEKVGGFDETFFAAEEIALSERLKPLGAFAILPHTAITSARKLESHPLREHLTVMAKSVLTGGRSLQSRDGLGLWYQTARGQTPPPANNQASTPE